MESEGSQETTGGGAGIGPLMPDSAAHIARLEAKLARIKKKEASSKVSAKEMLSSMSQFKDVYMSDRFRNNNQYNSNERTEANSMIVESIDKSYLERRLLPEQPISKEEVLKLVENDWLTSTDQDQEAKPTDQPAGASQAAH